MNLSYNDSFHRSIVFSNVPLSGKYRYKEIFQVSPAPSEWPPLSKAHFTNTNLPIILEYHSDYHIHHLLEGKISTIQNVEIENLTESFRYLDFEKELLALMSLVSNANFYTEKYPLNREQLGENYFTGEFMVPTSPEINLRDMGLLFNEEYTLGDEVSLPGNIDLILDKYFNLEGDLFIRFRMSLILFFNAIDIHSISPSMCFVALISSIENLVDIEGNLSNIKFKRCKSCSQTEYKVSRRFKDFVIEYANQDSEEFVKFLDEVYGMRSGITHIGKLLYHDFADTDVDYKSLITMKNLKKVVRFTLVNWLLARE